MNTNTPIPISNAVNNIITNLKTIYNSYCAHSCKQEGNAFIRLEQRIEDVDIISWLEQQETPDKFYYSNRSHTFEAAGIGLADSITGHSGVEYKALQREIEKKLSAFENEVRYYGGISFDTTQKCDGVWEEFGSYRFVLPLVEIFKQYNETIYAANILIVPGKSVECQLRSIESALRNTLVIRHSESTKDTVLLSRNNIPEHAEWLANAESVLSEIDSRHVEKIVLARRAVFSLSECPDPIKILGILKRTNPHSFHFCFQPSDGVAFVGGSPELLYSREGTSVTTEALAGTRRRGTTPKDDMMLEADLMQSEKERLEHKVVHTTMEAAFQKLCHSIEMPKSVSVLKNVSVQHLHSCFNGILKNGYSDFDIIASLHPTPSVSGFPVETAMSAIREMENFCRGWYAGPVGWIGKTAAEFAVGIRSGLIRNTTIHLFSGAGIVKGSLPGTEWQEIEHKIHHFLSILTGNGTP